MQRTMLKSTFSGLQHCRWRYGPVFLRLAVVASQIFEILLKVYLVQFKVIDLGVYQKRMCNFLLVINSNFGRISYSFQDTEALSIKWLVFPHPSLVWRHVMEERLAIST